MPLYGLIDCAADERIFPVLARERIQRSLFGGPIDEELLPATPHIVQLDEGSPFRQAFQSDGWTANWGIICQSEMKLMDVRRKLRRNLQAMLPDGTVCLFRFYDPRVWRSYIPVAEGEDLASWFDGIDCYWAPGTLGKGMLSYRLDGGVLSIQ